jgi:deoxyribonuclease (pyrimidine dimer)
MTRINIINPSELTDQHLVAEYRELFMVGSSLQRSLKSPNWDVNRIPTKFTLNTGHVMFFYDKGKYLHKRYKELREEMKVRGMKPDDTRVFKREQWPNELYNDWIPTIEDQKIIRDRIEERIAEKPDWYRKSH